MASSSETDKDAPLLDYDHLDSMSSNNVWRVAEQVEDEDSPEWLEKWREAGEQLKKALDKLEHSESDESSDTDDQCLCHKNNGDDQNPEPRSSHEKCLSLHGGSHNSHTCGDVKQFSSPNNLVHLSKCSETNHTVDPDVGCVMRKISQIKTKYGFAPDKSPSSISKSTANFEEKNSGACCKELLTSTDEAATENACARFPCRAKTKPAKSKKRQKSRKKTSSSFTDSKNNSSMQGSSRQNASSDVVKGVKIPELCIVSNVPENDFVNRDGNELGEADLKKIVRELDVAFRKNQLLRGSPLRNETSRWDNVDLASIVPQSELTSFRYANGSHYQPSNSCCDECKERINARRTISTIYSPHVWPKCSCLDRDLVNTNTNGLTKNDQDSSDEESDGEIGKKNKKPAKMQLGETSSSMRTVADASPIASCSNLGGPDALQEAVEKWNILQNGHFNIQLPEEFEESPPTVAALAGNVPRDHQFELLSSPHDAFESQQPHSSRESEDLDKIFERLNRDNQYNWKRINTLRQRYNAESSPSKLKKEDASQNRTKKETYAEAKSTQTLKKKDSKRKKSSHKPSMKNIVSEGEVGWSESASRAELPPSSSGDLPGATYITYDTSNSGTNVDKLFCRGELISRENSSSSTVAADRASRVRSHRGGEAAVSFEQSPAGWGTPTSGSLYASKQRHDEFSAKKDVSESRPRGARRKSSSSEVDLEFSDALNSSLEVNLSMPSTADEELDFSLKPEELAALPSVTMSSDEESDGSSRSSDASKADDEQECDCPACQHRQHSTASSGNEGASATQNSPQQHNHLTSRSIGQPSVVPRQPSMVPRQQGIPPEQPSMPLQRLSMTSQRPSMSWLSRVLQRSEAATAPSDEVMHEGGVASAAAGATSSPLVVQSSTAAGGDLTATRHANNSSSTVLSPDVNPFNFLYLTMYGMEANFLEHLFQTVVQHMLDVYPDLAEISAPPLTQAQFDEIPLVQMTALLLEQDRACPICLCEFELDEMCKQLSCNHIFHPLCIQAWFNRVATCPVCRRQELAEQRGWPAV